MVNKYLIITYITKNIFEVDEINKKEKYNTDNARCVVAKSPV